MSEYKEFTVTGRLGIDNLISLSPYTEGDWSQFKPYFEGYTEDEYKSDPESYHKRIETLNEWYIKGLKDGGHYGEEYQTHFKIKVMPELNDNAQVKPMQWGIMMPLGTINEDEPPKFGVKYKKP